MSHALRTLLATALVAGFAFSFGPAVEPVQPPAEKPVTEWKSAKEAKEAAEFLLGVSPTEADSDDIPALLKQLNHDDFDRRDQAAKALERLGPLAIAALHKAKRGKDADQAQRIGDVLDAILATWTRYDRVWSALRVLRVESDPAAVKAILAVLPVVAPEMELDDFTWLTLEKVVGTRPENLRALEPYLKAPLPARRAAAGCLLARHGTAAQREQARRLLTDTSVEVRLRTAQGLLGAGIAEVPALISLLDAEPLPLAWQAEELLVWWSDGAGPLERIGTGTAEERKTCQTAWRAWRPPAEKLASRRFCRPPGLFLAYAHMQRGWRLGVLGCDGQAHWWRETKTRDVLDLHMLPSGNALLYEEPREPVKDAQELPLCLIAERQPDGRLVWSKPGGGYGSRGFISPVCRRLIWGGTNCGDLTVLDLDDRQCRFTGQEDPQVIHSYWWQILPDGLGVRMSSGTPFGVPRALCYYLPAASVPRLRDREYRKDVPEALGPKGEKIRLSVCDSGLWSLINNETGVAVEMDGQSVVRHSLTVPDCKTLTPTEGGYLCTQGDRLWEVNRDGKMIWET